MWKWFINHPNASFIVYTFRPGTNMNGKQFLLGVGKFYTAEENWHFLRNMNDFEDESTSESEIEGDSSDSSKYAPEQQYQVRTDSNIQTLLPKETVNQSATNCAWLADETATTSGEEHVASPLKVSKVKEISAKGQNAAPKLVAKTGLYPKRHQHCVMKALKWMDKREVYILSGLHKGN